MANRLSSDGGVRAAALLMGMVLSLWLTTFAGAQAPRDLPLSLINANDRIAADQQQLIEQYVAYWAEQLGGEATTPADETNVFLAAQELVLPPSAATASSIFLLAYTRAALPKLEQIVTSAPEFNATQAMRVVAQLSTNEALAYAVQQLDPQREQRFGVRTWASKAVEMIIRKLAVDEGFRNQQLPNVLRRINDAATRETEWNILLHEFAAMASAGTAAAREQQMTLLETKLRQFGEMQEPLQAGTINMLSRVMISLRDQFTRMNDPAAQTQFGRNLAPVLVQFHENIVVPHWEAAQNDETVRTMLEGAIDINEKMLGLVHGMVKRTNDPAAPAPALAPAWKADNQPQFQSALGGWTGIVSAAPYR